MALGAVNANEPNTRQATSLYPEYVDLLVRAGIDSISVNADVLERTRHEIAGAEQRWLLTTALAAK